MSTNELDGNESIEPRTERALTECMTVLPEGGDVYTVVGENQNGEYQVDARTGVCSCDDFKYREPADGCKHVRRVAFATGARPVPIDVDGVDEHLGEHVESSPRRAAVADGGEVLEEQKGDGGDERPADCDCGDLHNSPRVDLPCWPCYRDGFREPNPEPTDE